MAGFLPILAGLGQAAQNYQQQRDAGLQNEVRRLQLQAMIQSQQREDQTARGLFTQLASGGLNLPGTTMRPTPGAAMTPQPEQPQMSAPDMGGGLRAGGALTGPGAAIASRLTALGISPDIAAGPVEYMRKNESGLRPDAVNPTSGALGVAQWLGPRKQGLQAKYGQQPNLDQQADYIGEELQGPERRTLDALRGAKSPKEAYDIWGRSFERPGEAALAKAGVGKDIEIGVQSTMKITPPQVYGMMSLPALAQQIDKANPDADPVVKMMMLEKAQKLMAPQQQAQWDAFKLQHDDVWRQADLSLRQRQMESQDRRSAASQAETHEYHRASLEGGGQIIETDQGPMRIPRTGSKAQPIDIGGAHVIGAKAGELKPENIVAFKDGEKVFSGSAQHTPQGWKNAATGALIDADRVEALGKTGEASAGRAGAQTARQLTSAREILSDLQNVADLPITVTRGIFGGREQGKGLLDALKENLAEKVTSEDAELTNSALSGLGRELSIVVSPVYGGKWAADTFNALTLKEGQTYLVKLYNLARMRQTVDNALEGVINTDWVGGQQKEFAKTMIGDLGKAIPWTPKDVLAYRDKAGKAESFRDFVARNEIAGKAKKPEAGGAKAEPGAGGESVPIPPAFKGDPDGTGYKRGADVWVKRGDVLVKTPGAAASP